MCRIIKDVIISKMINTINDDKFIKMLLYCNIFSVIYNKLVNTNYIQFTIILLKCQYVVLKGEWINYEKP